MSYYDYDEKDIAKTLKKAMSQGAAYDDVKLLLDARNEKINAGGKDMEKYRNDSITLQARNYLESKLKNSRGYNVDKLYEARENAVAENLKIANRKNKSAFERADAETKKRYGDQRDNLKKAYRADALSDEERLAAMGLGKGITNKPSSGYGESARANMFMGYQNSLYDSMAKENAERSANYENYVDAEDKSRTQYNDSMDEIYKQKASDSIEQYNKDREYDMSRNEADRAYNLKNQQYDRGVMESDRQYAFDSDKEAYSREQDAYQREKEKNDTEYERAINNFIKTGVVTDDRQAEILGLSKGTKTLEKEKSDNSYELDKQKVAISAAKAASSGRKSGSSGGSKSSSSSSFSNAYKLFQSIGYVATNEMSAALGVPIGTTYWQYDKQQQQNIINYGKFVKDYPDYTYQTSIPMMFVDNGKEYTNKRGAR